MTTRLLALISNNFSPSAIVFDEFDITTGVFIQEYQYADPPLNATPFCYPMTQLKPNGAVFTTGNSSGNNQALIRFSNKLGFVETSVLVSPLAGAIPPDTATAPYMSADGTGKLFGMWWNSPTMAPPAEVAEVRLVQLNVTSYAQALLGSNFQPASTGGKAIVVPGCVSYDGARFLYYLAATTGITPIGTQTRTVFAANTTTGLSSTFYTISAGWNPQAVDQFASVDAQNQVYIVWQQGGGANPPARVTVHQVNGTLILDKDFTGTYTLCNVAGLDDGSGFWVLGLDAAGLNWTLDKYSLPAGVLQLSVPVVLQDSNNIYFQMITIGISGVSGLTVDCDAGPALIITGTDFPVSPSVTVTGSNGVNVTFNIVSSTSTEIIVDTLNPAFVSRSTYCVTVG